MRLHYCGLPGANRMSACAASTWTTPPRTKTFELFLLPHANSSSDAEAGCRHESWRLIMMVPSTSPKLGTDRLHCAPNSRLPAHGTSDAVASHPHFANRIEDLSIYKPFQGVD